MRARTAIAAVLGLWLVVGVAAAQPWSGGELAGRTGDSDGPRRELTQPTILLASLTPFSACDELLGYVREHALEQVTAYGLMGGMPWMAFATDDAAMADMDTAGGAQEGATRAVAAPAAADGAQMGEDFSGTNVQEAGVDEPDVVKTDGRTLYTTVDGRIRALDLTGDRPVELGELRLEGDAWGTELLLDGDRLLVLGTAWDARRPGMPLPIEGDGGIGDARLAIMPAGAPAATITLVDVSDPARMTVVETLTLDGSYLSARLVDGIARVVVRAEPNGLPFVVPNAGGIQAEEEALERNREVVRASTAEQWLPFFIHTDATGARTDGTLLDCEAVHRPGEFSGLGTVTVLSIDPTEDLRPDGATAVLAGGETISASTDRLYVATNRWVDPVELSRQQEDAPELLPAPPSGTVTTELHAFDITAPTARYVASGSVPGQLLNQFSMSEHQGNLRVATTEGMAFWEGQPPQESRVAVLAERGDRLEEIGAVGGLGLDERIYAVRFLGEVGYVVTFRETDPLYTIDLSDPTAPRVLGELKIPGYSAYLHPIAEDLVIGVGQDADEQGMRLGAQISLFDVADLSDPQRIGTLALGDQSGTDVEHDHRAFLHWPATNLGVVPVQRWAWDPETQTEDTDAFAVGFVADRDGLREVGRVSHLLPPAAPEDARANPEILYRSGIRRSLVTGDALVTVSERGVLVSDLDSLAPRGFTAFSG